MILEEFFQLVEVGGSADVAEVHRWMRGIVGGRTLRSVERGGTDKTWRALPLGPDQMQDQFIATLRHLSSIAQRHHRTGLPTTHTSVVLASARTST